ncbi:hypothetical protein B7Z28_01655 [Candidatus Saccharibacteria bacterium 32-45-3]|nr:MAG: hypothetical protein B7Z28_01655 [Candidatus Saccharibacteria bacterium 32-45-3]
MHVTTNSQVSYKERCTEVISQKKGFTIIEVVLVLAIAGLIFLMVFIALPALQRGQRDGQRRDDVSRVISQLTSYSTNNRGALPATLDTNFLNNYMKAGDGEFNDPKSGVTYTVAGSGVAGDATLPDGQIQYIRGVKCNGENATTTGAGVRQAAVRIKLEGSGHFCQDAK